MSYFAVIVAAGEGARFKSQTPKQYHPLLGTPILSRALAPFIALPEVEGIVVVLAKNDQWFSRTREAAHPKVQLAQGGKTRAESVLNGLKALANRASASDWILVHDAARPCLSIRDVEMLMEAVGDDAVGGLLIKSVTDTLKYVGEPSKVATVPREQYVCAQTPQLFRYPLLLDALENSMQSPQNATDDAQAIEQLGYHPKLVVGPAYNIKVTVPEDMALAEFYCASLDLSS